ncbi:MAG TPA: hypothetical protein PK395_00305 [bacterium]|nr:hypothetical protein [bacterium]HQP97513.1 hypothetical protein [bacterium]
MTKHVFLVFSLIFLIPCSMVIAQTDAERGQAFILESKRLPVAERVDRAVLTIQNSTDDAVVAEAVTDLAQFWNNPEDKLAVIEDVLSKADKKSKTFQRAELAKARTLARLGQKAESHAIFEKAIADGNEKALHFYHNSLWETGDYAKVAIDTYKRLAESAQDDPAKYEKERDFVGMFDSLRAMRVIFPESSAIKEVYSQLNDSEVRPLAKPLAEVVCLSADDRYGEALAALDKVQELLQSGKYTGPDEGKNVALLRAAVLFFEGRDFDVARDALRKYLELNTDNPGRALCRLSFFMCTMEQALVDSQKALELTSMLMDEGYLTDKYISQDEFRKWELHGLLHHHQKAVAFAGKWDESTRLCIEIMEDYYPDTMAGANSALGLALYISWHDKDWDGAERLLNDVLENAPYDGIAPFVYAALAEIADARGDRAKALTLLEQSFDRIGTAPYGRGPVQHLRENSQRLRSKILGQ